RSYKQWEEGGVAPQVVFEVVSEGNSIQELTREKKRFYEQYGAEEYYIYDPDTGRWSGFIRQGNTLRPIEAMEGWVSPRLGIRFGVGHEADPGVYDPEGNRFASYLELRAALEQAIEQERARAEEARRQAEQERQRAEEERQRAARAEAELQRLRQLLREHGIDVD
ncbi:MAG: Uma2 family endonuclease, partial [Gloeomargarita sp. SKYB31]|nr:Uma2 family endonuclease [Gloeomargarita sp. SKYB31]